MRTGTVARDVGRILQVVSITAFASVLVSVAVREYYAVPSFILTGVIILGVGTAMSRYFADAPEPGKLHGMLVAATAWALVGTLGSLPFLGVAYTIEYAPAWTGAPAMTETFAAFLNPLNSLFESWSGFTGTGLTMAVTEEDLPASVQWWRSLIEWVGGVGVIVLTVAVLARPGSGSLTLYESEARSEKIHPNIVSTVRDIWKIYVGLTLASVVLFFFVGMPFWDAINHAMTGIATGGFSVHAASIGHYGEPIIEYAVVPVMVAGSIAFPVHYLIFKGEIRNFYADLQTRWVFIWFAAGTVILTAVLHFSGTYSTFEETFRFALFQFVSGTSNAGFGTAAIGGGTERVWGAGATLIVCAGMLTGAAAGSTVSGVKLIRVLVLFKGIWWRIQGLFVPESAVRRLELGDRVLDEDEVTNEFEEAGIVVVLYFVFLVLGLAVVLAALPEEVHLEYALFEVMSAQSNVGLTAGITGPGMPDVTKMSLMLNMWVGRLEIIPVLVLIRAALVGTGSCRVE